MTRSKPTRREQAVAKRLARRIDLVSGYVARRSQFRQKGRRPPWHVVRAALRVRRDLDLDASQMSLKVKPIRRPCLPVSSSPQRHTALPRNGVPSNSKHGTATTTYHALHRQAGAWRPV